MSEANNINLLQIAQVLKSNGTDGELVMSFRDIAPDEIDIKEPVFIYFDGLPVPFFIESLVKRGTNKALVHLTGIHNLKDAEEVVSQAVYVDEDLYEDEDDGFDYDELIGWTMKNEKGEIVGTISDFEDIPGNPCVYVDTKNNVQAMVPLHEDLILDVNYDDEEITLQIPEGLLDA